jgi:histidinol-phosphate phosphatase family protein
VAVSASTFGVVVPTVGRPSLGALLASIGESRGELPDHVVVVDDRRASADLSQLLDVLVLPDRLAGRVTVRRSGGRGPAAARNVGWRSLPATCEWVVFLDDDVLVGDDWLTAVRSDLDQPGDVAGVQGRISVPLPADRRPTDWERATAGLETAAWITADMAYRRRALDAVGGFDERFPRAFREDADLALRIQRSGAQLVRGARRTTHPVRPADRWASVRVQAGNGDDPLMRRVHGRHWRRQAAAPRGRRPEHLLVTAAAGAALTSAAARRPLAATAATTLWLAGTARFAWTRVAPGPRDRAEVATMALTSALIPPVAIWHWLRGLWLHRNASSWPVRKAPRAVLFDRDGTLVHDVPYNGDPAKVRPVEGAVELVAGLRARGIRTGVITNQSGIARGLLTAEQVRRVNARIDELFGGFDVWAVCPHADADRCGCRKPAPGMVLQAAADLGVAPDEVVLVGDIGADVEAASAAGARGVLVPTEQTRREEIAAAPHVASDLAAALRTALEPVR